MVNIGYMLFFGLAYIVVVLVYLLFIYASGDNDGDPAAQIDESATDD